MAKQNRVLFVVVAVVLGLWLLLFFSSKGLLIWGDTPDGERKVGMLKCHYFTGTGVVEKQFLYSSEGFLGRQACPRTVDLK